MTDIKLTIGMPCYSDYSGAWFTTQALRLNHTASNIEFLVVDTKGDDTLKGFVTTWGGENCRYIRDLEPHGTAPAKNKVFENARGEFVLCIDSHVLFMPDSIEMLLKYINDNPTFDGLGYGVLVYDNLMDCSTHMEAVWRGHMWGIWANNIKIDQVPLEPFEIWGHGGGCFLSKRDAWLGFHKDFRGFGGEEGYLPEKYRKQGKKVLCLPFLKWIHRFGTPNGTGYRLHVDDRIRNYLIGFRELELDTKPICDHFGQAETEKVMQSLGHDIVIKSFNGIGDLLYATPTFSAIKKANPGAKIIVNTNYPQLLEGNPHVEIGNTKEGVFLGYPDVIHRKQPTQHHILSDWQVVCKEYGLSTDMPAIKPEIYMDLPKREGGVIVQVEHKNSWHGKKAWPHAEKFADTYGFTKIPHFEDVRDLVRFIAKAQLVVCMEGGVHHIAAAVGTPAIVILPAFTQKEWVGYDGQKYIQNKCDLSEDCYNPDPCKHTSKNSCMNVTIQYVYNEVLDSVKQPIRLYPTKKKLNLGSGDMLLLNDWVNFDLRPWKRHGIATDSFGLIEHITEIYDTETFDEILCAHVIEHFLLNDAVSLLKDILSLLTKGGKLILEGPDVLGGYELYAMKQKNLSQWNEMIFSHGNAKKYGEEMRHVSCWSGETAKRVMEEVGYEIAYVGPGRTHGMGPRDFRVEGIKC